MRIRNRQYVLPFLQWIGEIETRLRQIVLNFLLITLPKDTTTRNEIPIMRSQTDIFLCFIDFAVVDSIKSFHIVTHSRKGRGRGII